MNVVETLKLCKENNIELSIVDGKLKVVSYDGKIADSIKNILSENKQVLLDTLGTGSGELSPAIPSQTIVEGTEKYQLSYAQQRLWFISKLAAGKSTYNISTAIGINGDLYVNSLERAFEEILRRHTSLRTVYGEENGQPYQRILADYAFKVDKQDISHLSPEEQETYVADVADREANYSFDLSKEVLLRVCLLKMSGEKHALIFSMSHIASDGWSMNVFVNELTLLYRAFRDGKDYPLEPLPIQYVDFARWQREWLQGDVLEKHLTFWKRSLENLPQVHNLPLDKPRPAHQSFAGAQYEYKADRKTLKMLREFCSAHGTTLFITLQAALAVFISRYSGESDVVIGSPTANRSQKEVEPVIGCFVNSLVLRSDLSGNPSFRELLTVTKKNTLAAYAHQQLPFEMLVEEINPERSLGHNPLFQVALNVREREEGSDLINSMDKFYVIDQETVSSRFDICLCVEECNEGLSLMWEYASDLFEQDTIVRFAENFARLLTSIMASPDEKVEILDMLAGEEKALLKAWNQTQVNYPQDVCIDKMFERRVEEKPDSLALQFGRESLTYGELNRRANQLARYLRDIGVGRDTMVGLFMERSIEMVVGVLGIMKAGGAYVPLDPNYPEQRIDYILNDAELEYIVTEKDLADEIDVDDRKVVFLDEEVMNLLCAEYSEDNLSTEDEACSPDQLAYVIYTSGSTGMPKGVLLEHKGLANLARAQSKGFGIDAGSKVLQFASMSFDASVSEIAVTLSVGAELYIVSDGQVKSPDLLQRYIEDNQVTHATLPPVLLSNLDSSRMPTLKTLVVAGEAIAREAAEQWATDRKLINAYGPTENTVCVSLGEYTGGRVDMGGPIDNVQCQVLDNNRNRVPIGVPGELYVAGTGLARKYLNNDVLNQDKFIHWEDEDGSSVRMYKTGDLVRWLANGKLEFIGRIDNQVKVRGYRIELGEIEAQIMKSNLTREAAVLVREDEDLGKKLVAYVVPLQEQDENQLLSAILKHLKAKLPDYMLPNNFVVLDKLPVTINGKVDSKALAVYDSAGVVKETYVEPSSETEKYLCEIWQQELQLEKVGAKDNFFSLGGHSLVAVSVIAKIREQYNIDISVAALFENPSVRDFAEEVDRLAEENREVMELIPISDKTYIPLSYMQQNMWKIAESDSYGSSLTHPVAYFLHGFLDKEDLIKSLQIIINRQASLRTRFEKRDDDVVQVIDDHVSVSLQEEDLSGAIKEDDEEHNRKLVDDRLEKELAWRFDLSADYPYRFSLVRLSDIKYLFVVNIHHLISDGWSLDLFLRELSSLYESLSMGTRPALPELEIDYGDYAVCQQQWHQSECYRKERDYWIERLADYDYSKDFPVDCPRNELTDYQRADRDIPLSDDAYAKITEYCSELGITNYIFFMAVFQLALSRHSGLKDIAVYSPYAERDRMEIENSMGVYLNAILIKSRVEEDDSLRDFVSQVRKGVVDAQANSHVNIGHVMAQDFAAENEKRKLLRMECNYLDKIHSSDWELFGLDVEAVDVDYSSKKSFIELSMTISKLDNGLKVQLSYLKRLFSVERIDEICESIAKITNACLLSPDVKINSL